MLEDDGLLCEVGLPLRITGTERKKSSRTSSESTCLCTSDKYGVVV